MARDRHSSPSSHAAECTRKCRNPTPSSNIIFSTHAGLLALLPVLLLQACCAALDFSATNRQVIHFIRKLDAMERAAGLECEVFMRCILHVTIMVYKVFRSQVNDAQSTSSFFSGT
jgi:hypothetical protein